MNESFPIVPERTKADGLAERMADHAAESGKWETFVGKNPGNENGLSQIVQDGKEATLLHMLENRQQQQRDEAAWEIKNEEWLKTHSW